MEDSQGSPRYVYKGLAGPEEFRLLHLLPGSESDELRCSLRHVPISSKPNFEALSYAWGYSAKPRRVLCDGLQISITESLFIALRYLRYQKDKGASSSREEGLEDGERCIWVDAICINQGNDKEKNGQVALMGRIFSQARITVVWLGEDKADKGASAFGCIRWLDEYLREHAKGYENPGIYHPNLIIEDQFKVKLLGENVQNFNNQISPLFKQSWFKRLWVVQEFVLAQEAHLVFGIRTIPLKTLVKATTNQKALNNLTGIGFIRRIYMREYKGPSDRSYNILELQQALGLLKCVDPRDRIYSVLSLISTEGLRPDYSLNTEEVFQNFSNWALNVFPDLKVLSYARGLSQNQWKLPTWNPCPNIEHLGGSFLNIRHFQACGTIYNNDENLQKFYFQEPGHDVVLGLEGVLVDSVRKVAKLPLARGASDEEIQMWETMKWDFRRSLIECRETSKSVEKSPDYDLLRHSRFCSAMIFNLSEKHQRAPAEYGKWFQTFLETAINEIEHPEIDWYQESLNTNNIIASIISMWAFRRRFCLTSRDRFAWVPESAECGDKICIIRGARVPYIVRMQPNGKFGLVGECWIEGLMEGEALQLLDFKWEPIYLI